MAIEEHAETQSALQLTKDDAIANAPEQDRFNDAPEIDVSANLPEVTSPKCHRSSF